MTHQSELIERLSELLAKATPGPYRAHDHEDMAHLGEDPAKWVGYAWVGRITKDSTPDGRWDAGWADMDRRKDGSKEYRERASADAHFVAEALNALPALLSALKQQEGAPDMLVKAASPEECIGGVEGAMPNGITELTGNEAGRVEIPASHPLYKAMRPSAETMAAIERDEQVNAAAMANATNTLLGAASPGGDVGLLVSAVRSIACADTGTVFASVSRSWLESVAVALNDQSQTLTEAATLIEVQSARIAALEKGLEPFARTNTECALGIVASNETQVMCGHCTDPTMLCHAYRTARALTPPQPRNDGDER